MGFSIDCIRGAEIIHAARKSTISADQIKQIVGDTKLMSGQAFKGEDEARRATFSATTAQGIFTWHVLFSVGDGDAYVDEVLLVSAPPGAIVQSNPAFEIRDLDS
ncbi:hypothetical protein IPC1622_29170 [Pseudomonas aeruginosa]|uniref:hypothetical protein n=1 Tax=Pseudomonas aeruginosa TaxID=287 RepID=UPI000F886CA7|nr:hypothetical protein [Pseudomonas aeruginosa]ELS1858900.1 hypothetical protein [Pseudomonas aeruginosa]MCQ9820443.1 hypothetical protein [Pseudomonas aeruginosa]RUA40387.1 hypothetical protein IPC1622_29170 [Pseudomonas aeruginosa]